MKPDDKLTNTDQQSEDKAQKPELEDVLPERNDEEGIHVIIGIKQD
jgi:hypothetical protein